MDIAAMLGIDENDPRDRLAGYIIENDEQLIAKLVARRKGLGLSQSEVAERMQIDKSGVSKIESGNRDLRQSTIQSYAMAVDAVVVHDVRAFEDYEGAKKAREYLARGYGERASGGVPIRTSQSARTAGTYV